MRALFIIDNGNGTIHVEREPSWNTPENKPNQLAKFDIDKDELPVAPEGIPQKHWAWNGSAIVECDQATKDAIAAQEAAAASDAKDRTAILPNGVQEAFKATIEQVEANKAVTCSILSVMLAKNVITQEQHDAALAQIPAMTNAEYAARWRSIMDE